MPILDIFRNLFGIKSNQQNHPNYGPEIPRQENESFRNPIWENEDDDDDEYNSDFRQPNGGGVHFEVFGDPFQMTLYFESQIDSILKNFLDGFPGQRGFMVPFDDESTFESSLPALPEPPKRGGTSLRDRILKREFQSPEDYSREYPKADSDLDGKISANELTKVWKDPSTQEMEPTFTPRNSITSRFSGTTTSTQIIRRSDGTLEKRQTFKDSNGNEQTVVTRQIGDKMHEIITKRDKQGAETKTENFVNMDENEIQNFDNKWKSGIVQNPPDLNPSGGYFPWHKFFGPEPKL